MLKKELKAFSVSIEKPFIKKFPYIAKGKYVLRIIHSCQAAYQRPKSLFTTFEIKNISTNKIKKLLGLKGISAQYGVFGYIGGGKEIGGYYAQEVFLNLDQDISDLVVTLRTFLPTEKILVDAFQIYNASMLKDSILEEGLFFKHANEVIADDHQTSSTINFNELNLFSSVSFFLSPTSFRGFAITNLDKGEYYLKVIHQNKMIHKSRKSIVAAFDSSELIDIDQKKKILGINKVSNRYGLFEYMGGGTLVNDDYVQDMYLNTTGFLGTLNISFHSLMPKDSLMIKSIIFGKRETLNTITSFKNGSEENQKQIDINLADRAEQAVLNKKIDKVDVLLYADITPNVIDGSSIWLTSIINILSKKYNVLVLFKDTINSDKNVISNILAENYHYLEPQDLGLSKPFNNSLAVEVLRELDKILPSVKAVVTRGYDLALAIQQDDTFIGRKCIYLTDFYLISDEGFTVPEHRFNTLKSVLLNSDYLLVQTNQIKDKLEELTSITPKTISLPPSLPHNIFDYLKRPDLSLAKDAIHIGYAGKVQPRWGVEELLLWSKELRNSGIKVHLHIATGKIYSSKKGDNFVMRIQGLLQDPNVTLYSGLDRFGAMSLMREMDYVWCYRDSLLETSTLEISTKLIEMAALGKSTICYPSEINKDLLGRDYPYFIENKNDFFHLLEEKSINFDFLKLAEKIKIKHSFGEIVNNFDIVFSDESNKPLNSSKNILIAGHDLKFINPWISHLKKVGYQVKVDEWEWGAAKDENRSKRLLQWADIIFCEWGLANAVWYSQNNLSKKPLYIRAHAQEVRDKARKFGKQIVIDNVTQVIFVADHIRRKALELWQWSENKTLVIPNFLLTEKFTLRTSPLKLNLGMVGIIPQTKRFDRAIELLEKLVLEGKDAHLYIKGHRPEDLPFMHAPGRKKELEYYDKLYQKISDSTALKDRVHFEGWGNNVAEWYQKIDFILSPSDAESFHYALADGVLSGCIPIVWNWDNSDVTYPKNWIVKNDVEALENIDKLLQLEFEDLDEFRSKNRQILYKKYSNDRVYNELLDIVLKG